MGQLLLGFLKYYGRVFDYTVGFGIHKPLGAWRACWGWCCWASFRNGVVAAGAVWVASLLQSFSLQLVLGGTGAGRGLEVQMKPP